MSSATDSDLHDTLTLIADYLERTTPLSETACALRKEIQEKNVLPDVVSWDGRIVPGSLTSSRDLRALPGDHLVRCLRFGGEPASSVLEIARSTVQKKRGDGVSDAQRAQELVALRAEQRELVREMSADRGRSRAVLQAVLEKSEAHARSLVQSLMHVPRILDGVDISVVDVVLDPSGEFRNSKGPWRTAVGKYRILKKIAGHRAQAYCVALAEKDHWIITGADDFVAKLWDGRTGHLRACFRGHKKEITDLTVSRDGLLASASEDCAIRVWDSTSTKPFISISRHRNPVQRVEFSKDGSVLFSAAEDGACCVWNIQGLRNEASVHAKQDEVWMAKELERRRHAALAANTTTTSTTTTTANSLNATIELLMACPVRPLVPDPPLVFPHVDAKSNPIQVHCMAIHPTGKFVVTGAQDSVARVWSVDDVTIKPKPPAAHTTDGLISAEYRDGANHLLCTLRGHTAGPIAHVEWSRAGDRVLSLSTSDVSVRVWSWARFNEKSVHTEFASVPTQITLQAVPSATALHFSTGKTRGPSARLVTTVGAASFSADDRFVVSTQSIRPPGYDVEDWFSDSLVCVWDSRSGDLLRFMRGHRMQAAVLRVHPELGWLASTCGTDGLILFWDLVRGKEIGRVECLAPEGYPEVLDAKWSTKSENRVADFVATDSLGNLIMIGTGEDSPLCAAYSEQYMSNEIDPMAYHANTNDPIDAQMEVPFHLLYPQPRLTNGHNEIYEIQPPPADPGQGRFPLMIVSPPKSDDDIADERKRRIDFIANRERERAARESDARTASQAVVKLQLDKIEEAKRLDVELATPSTSMTGNESSLANTKFPKPKPAVPKRTQQRASGPMLAYERAMFDRGSTTSDEDEEEEEEESVQGVRSRRRAAKQANARIHRHARHFDDGEEPSFISRAEAADETFRSGDRHRHTTTDEDDAASGSEETTTTDDDDDLGSVTDDDEDGSAFSGSHAARGPRVVRPTRSRRQVNYAELEANPARGIRGQAESSSSQADGKSTDVVYNDGWLSTTAPSSAFVPQREDLVVYFPQGHLDYLQEVSSKDAPPCQLWNTLEWPFVCCRVLDVTYVNPRQTSTIKPHRVLCNVELEIVQVKGPAGSSSVFVDYIPNDDPISPFHVLYESFTSPEFLVLKSRVLAVAATQLNAGMEVRCFYPQEDDFTEYQLISAVVTRIQVEYPDQWPDSPWNAVRCKPIEDGVPFVVSPWQVDTSTNGPKLIVDDEARAFSSSIPDFDGKPIMTWIVEQFELCPHWYTFLRSRRAPGVPCFISLDVIRERLEHGGFYRTWEAIECDLDRFHDCTVFCKPLTSPVRPRAEHFLREMKEIVAYARYRTYNDADDVPKVRRDVVRVMAMQAVDECVKEDEFQYFLNPVDVDELPGYLDVVKTPMDFSTIRKRISEQTLPGAERIPLPEARSFLRTVLRDVRQISLNAVTYNLETSPAYRSAKKISSSIPHAFAGYVMEDALHYNGSAPRMIPKHPSSERRTKADASFIPPGASATVPGNPYELVRTKRSRGNVGRERTRGNSQEVSQFGRSRTAGADSAATVPGNMYEIQRNKRSRAVPREAAVGVVGNPYERPRINSRRSRTLVEEDVPPGASATIPGNIYEIQRNKRSRVVVEDDAGVEDERVNKIPRRGAAAATTSSRAAASVDLEEEPKSRRRAAASVRSIKIVNHDEAEFSEEPKPRRRAAAAVVSMKMDSDSDDAESSEEEKAPRRKPAARSTRRKVESEEDEEESSEEEMASRRRPSARSTRRKPKSEEEEEDDDDDDDDEDEESGSEGEASSRRKKTAQRSRSTRRRR